MEALKSQAQKVKTQQDSRELISEDVCFRDPSNYFGGSRIESRVQYVEQHQSCAIRATNKAEKGAEHRKKRENSKDQMNILVPHAI